MQQVLEQALEQYRRQQILHAANAAYGALLADPSARIELEKERAAWNVTLADGLADPTPPLVTPDYFIEGNTCISNTQHSRGISAQRHGFSHNRNSHTCILALSVRGSEVQLSA
jgi:hypothetical protein